MNSRFRFLRLIIPLFILMFLTPIACNFIAPKPTAGPNLIQSTPEKSSTEKSSTVPASVEIGYSRQNPLPQGTLASIPGWDIKVDEFLRGEAALKVINTGNWQAKVLPKGQEYVLAKVFVRCTALDDKAHSLGISELSITGSHNIAYGDTMDGWPQPEFLFEDMFTAEAVDGWVDGVVPTDEKNLMAVLDVWVNNKRYTRYFALENGASISLPQELSSLKPNNLGAKVNAPAPHGQQVISPEWEITTLDIVKGQEAVTILQKDNPAYAPPEEGLKYILLQVKLRYFSPTDVPAWIDSSNFYAVDKSGNRIKGKMIFTPKQSERAWIGSRIFPGAGLEGWVVVSIPAGTDQTIIAFDPDLNAHNRTGQNLRYLAIE